MRVYWVAVPMVMRARRVNRPLFSRVLLLGAGRCVYYGPSCDFEAASDPMRDFFATAGAPCPPFENPADHILDTINTTAGAGASGGGGGGGGGADDETAPALFPVDGVVDGVVDGSFHQGVVDGVVDEGGGAASDGRSATVEVRAWVP
eukprot:COSAG01_NODE_88_length_27337_cov_22.941699_13_plen_148_part_00